MQDGHYWPLAVAPVGDSRGSFRGQSGRRKFQPPRQLMTQLRHQCVNIAVTRNTGPLTKND
jgi:hypothetical protein